MKVAATGLVCAVGLRADAACAAIRAGISRIGELEYLDNDARPIFGAAVPGIALDLCWPDRLVELLSRCLMDLICVAKPLNILWQEVPILVGVAEPGRPQQGELGDLISRVERRLDLRFSRTHSQLVPLGHASVFEGLRRARGLMKQRLIPACVVCGVDSYLNGRALQWLEQGGRLKTWRNSDGVIPGEAAAAVLVTPVAGRSRVATEVAGLGSAQEVATVDSESPLLGLGLAQAVREALLDAKVEMHEIDGRIADVTGESYGFREQILTVARTLRGSKERLPIWHAADSIGDVGAAAGGWALCQAQAAFQRAYAPGRLFLATTSAVDGTRAAAILRALT